MPGLAAIIVLAVAALAIGWKARCIWRGCTIDREEREERAGERSGRAFPPRHL